MSPFQIPKYAIGRAYLECAQGMEWLWSLGTEVLCNECLNFDVWKKKLVKLLKNIIKN